MYPSSSLLGQKKDESIVALPVDELIEKADGFAGVFPGTITNTLYASCAFLELISSLFFVLSPVASFLQSTSMKL